MSKPENQQLSCLYFFIFLMRPVGPSLRLRKVGDNRIRQLLLGLRHDSGVQKTLQIHQRYFELRPRVSLSVSVSRLTLSRRTSEVWAVGTRTHSTECSACNVSGLMNQRSAIVDIQVTVEVCMDRYGYRNGEVETDIGVFVSYKLVFCACVFFRKQRRDDVSRSHENAVAEIQYLGEGSPLHEFPAAVCAPGQPSRPC